MKIAFLTRKDPYDKGAWSGAFYSMFSELERDNQVEWIRPRKRPISSKFTLSILHYWHRFTSKKSLNIINKFYARSTVSDLTNQLKERDFDIIFAAASPELIAYLDCKIPIVYFLDATFIQLSQDYPAFSNLPDWNHQQAMEIESNALRRATHIIVSSEWAKNSVINNYNIDPVKVSIISFGANMVKIPTDQDISLLVKRKTSQKEPLKLLFIGKNWKRKGGKYALEAFFTLNDKGTKTALTIIGSIPPEIPEKYNSLLYIIPALNKNIHEDFVKLYKHFEEAHFFILPTRGDCTPIVFSEAAAFGLPVITTNTGGVKDVVEDGVSGVVLSMEASGLDYAEAILQIYNQPDMYKKVAYQSRDRYVNILNWKTWLQSTMEILEKIQSK